jgi:hypothetical protein
VISVAYLNIKGVCVMFVQALAMRWCRLKLIQATPVSIIYYLAMHISVYALPGVHSIIVSGCSFSMPFIVLQKSGFSKHKIRILPIDIFFNREIKFSKIQR